jgi:hypothetical protein
MHVTGRRNDFPPPEVRFPRAEARFPRPEVRSSRPPGRPSPRGMHLPRRPLRPTPRGARTSVRALRLSRRPASFPRRPSSSSRAPPRMTRPAPRSSPPPASISPRQGRPPRPLIHLLRFLVLSTWPSTRFPSRPPDIPAAQAPATRPRRRAVDRERRMRTAPARGTSAVVRRVRAEKATLTKIASNRCVSTCSGAQTP